MNEEDKIRLQNHKCPHCHAPVKSVWNLKTTGQVVCIANCEKGQYNMDMEECLIVEDNELDTVEDLEEV